MAGALLPWAPEALPAWAGLRAGWRQRNPTGVDSWTSSIAGPASPAVWMLAAVHVVADASDHAAAGEKNASAPLIKHQHVVVEHGSENLLKTVTQNSTMIQASHQ